MSSGARKNLETESQLRTEFLEKKFAGKTDRQLLEEQTHLAQLRNKDTESIKRNIQFFFWIAIVSMVLWFIINIVAESGPFKH